MQHTIMNPTGFDPVYSSRAQLSPLVAGQSRASTHAAQIIVRSPLAQRAHELHGIGPIGQARRGMLEAPLRRTFGGDVAAWQQVGHPWIAARSLAKHAETLASSSAVGWLLASSRR